MLNHADPFIKASAEKLLRQIIELGAETSMTKKPMSHSAMMGFGYPQQIDGESSSSEEENYPSASEENDDPPQELASPPMSPRVGSKRTASEREEKPSDALDEEKEAKKARADEAKSSADAPKEETKGSEAPAAESRQKSEDKASTNVEEPWDKIRTLANESEHLSPLQTLQYVTQMVLSDHKKHSDLTNLSNSAVNLTEEKHEKGATHSPPRSQETADS